MKRLSCRALVSRSRIEEAKVCSSVITSIRLKPAGIAEVLSGREPESFPPPAAGVADPTWVLIRTASSFAVTMSLRIASEMADVTKLATENGIMIIARQIATAQYARTAGRESRLLALKLSAVTGLRCAASFVNESSRLAAVVLLHPVLQAVLAAKTWLRMSGSTSIPISAAYLRRRSASSRLSLKRIYHSSWRPRWSVIG